PGAVRERALGLDKAVSLACGRELTLSWPGPSPEARVLPANHPQVKDLLEYLARQLVDEPDAVRVEEAEEDDARVLRLHVAPEDVGKVIGRQGRVARALRTLVRAAGSREHRRVLLEIVD